MSNLVDLARKLHEVGLIPSSRLRRLQIHQSYWVLREGGTSPSEAVCLVAESFGVSEDTVETYSKNRDRFSELNPLT